MSCQQMEPQTTSSTLEAMRLQETTAYRCQDYLRSPVKPASPTSAILRELFVFPRDLMRTEEDLLVCISNRSKMAQWCMTLMDACQLNRETVSIAMSYLDRFLATPSGSDCIEDSAMFQLACMTALYSAIKIHEEKAISPEALSTISRGFYTKADMEAMEWRMLNALQWRVNVPTPMAFVREYLKLIPFTLVGEVAREQLVTLAKVQTEHAVLEYNLVTVNPSSIGFAALVNAMEVLGLPVVTIRHYIFSVGGKQNVVDMQEVLRIQAPLYLSVADMTGRVGGTCGQEARRVDSSPASEAPKRRQSHLFSPRAVCQTEQLV